MTPRRTPSTALGVAVALAAIALTTLAIYPLREHAPVVSTGVLYLLAVLLVATLWGLRLGLLTGLAGAVAFNYFHIPPTGRLTVSQAPDAVALAVFLATAVAASAVAELARRRRDEAERRREEADLAAELAQVLLGGQSTEEALPAASVRLAAALGVPYAAIAPDGAVELPEGVRPAVRERLDQRIRPALAALLGAARERDRLQAEVVETQALRRSDVIKTALLRAVSHDLRTPLTAIVAAGEALRSPGIDDRSRDELGAVVSEEGDRLSRLIEKLLDLSRLQAGEAEPRRDWCSIDEAIEAALEHADPAVPVEVRTDRDLPLVRADAAQLERVFANLIENAQRHAGGHPVQIRARATSGRLLVRVIDRGPGIPGELLPYVFEPFRRGGDGSHGGSGLGLAIVKGFVEAVDGRVWAESLPGQGTVFVVELPLTERPVARA